MLFARGAARGETLSLLRKKVTTNKSRMPMKQSCTNVIIQHQRSIVSPRANVAFASALMILSVYQPEVIVGPNIRVDVRADWCVLLCACQDMLLNKAGITVLLGKVENGVWICCIAQGLRLSAIGESDRSSKPPNVFPSSLKATSRMSLRV